MDQSWVGWAELSKPLWKEHVESTIVSAGKMTAVHLCFPDCPLASTVVLTVESPLAEDDDEGVDVRIHPVLFEFMIRVRSTWIQIKERKEECLPVDLRKGHTVARIGPLPVEPLLPSIDHDLIAERRWQVSVVSVEDLPKSNVHVFLSCIFMDNDLSEYRDTVSADFFEFTIQNCLVGRVIRKGSVAVVACKYGFAIVELTEIQWTSGEGSETTTCSEDIAYRIPVDSRSWEMHLDIPETAYSHSMATGNGDVTLWESSIPGYEPLQDQIMALVSTKSSPAAPTAVLLCGCPGVGKSRLASSVAYEHSIQRAQESSSTTTTTTSTNAIFYLSVRDLILRAVTESDLFQAVIQPSIRTCTLWILDDLHLLERDDSGEEASQFDVEYTSVCNAILQAIDTYHSSCFILGVGQVTSKLPATFTKNGRFEKQIEMLPPTQSQRVAIWNHLLLNDVPIESIRTTWREALAKNSAGCVAADLVRAHQDAWTRCWARNPQEEMLASFEWEDLREAMRHCIPSQLSELDVTKPRVFPSDWSFREIHQECWKSIAGYEKLKIDVFRQVVVPWKQLLQWDESQATEESWIDPPPGVLFHGESGCGKTEAVKCLAGSLGLSMIQVRASDVLDKWLGGSEALLRSLFARARAAAPCILFIDEIDSIACNRAEDDTNESSSRILSTLLNEMDGVSSEVRKGKILVAACTNRLEALDAALLRPGRIQEHFQLLRPTPKDLVCILNLYLERVPTSQGVNREQIAAALFAKKCAGADVEGLIREVCFLAFRNAETFNSIEVSPDEFSKAIATL